jgi:hypothetical protein
MGKSREHKRCHARKARSRLTWSLERRLHQSQPSSPQQMWCSCGRRIPRRCCRWPELRRWRRIRRHLGCFHLPLPVFIHPTRTPRMKAAATAHDHLCTCDSGGGGRPPRNSGGALLRPVRIKRKKKNRGQIRPLQPAAAPPSQMLVLALMPPMAALVLALAPLPRATAATGLQPGRRSEGVGCVEKWQCR